MITSFPLTREQSRVVDRFILELTRDHKPDSIKIFTPYDASSNGLDVVTLEDHEELRDLAFMYGVTCGLQLAKLGGCNGA